MKKTNIYTFFLFFISAHVFSQEVQCNIYNYENGVKRVNGEPYTGVCKTIESGKIILSGAFKSGQQHGRWEYFTGEGKIEKIESYNEGKKDGVFEDYVLNDYGNLNLLSKKNYKNDKPNGTWESYINGVLYQIENYIDGIKHGEYKDYDIDTGELRELKNLKTINGTVVEDGIQVEYKKNGKNDTITFKNGLKDGLIVRYHQNGKLRERTTWINGKISDGIHNTFDDNGLLLSREEYKDGIRDGIYEQYYMGKKWLWGVLKNGKKEGRWEEYSDYGILDKKKSGYFENDIRIKGL